MIEICNLRNEKPKFEYDIKVDRSNRILGNKFYMNIENERDKVCEEYENWFYEQLSNNNQLVINELERLHAIYERYGKLRLFCWCYPKRCHAKTIKSYIEKQIRRNKNEN